MIHLEDAMPMPVSDLLRVIQAKVTQGSKYFGIPTMKCPMDFWVYQEILWDVKPDIIFEIGTWHGGSALALAHLCDQLGKGQVWSIDKNLPPKFYHPRITWVTADATEVDALRISVGKKVLVIEDSSHEYDNTLKVLEKYGPLVTPGSYLIVEDTICRHGLDAGPYPGPYEAVAEYIRKHPEFEVDRTREPYLITYNPAGYLIRKP